MLWYPDKLGRNPGQCFVMLEGAHATSPAISLARMLGEVSFKIAAGHVLLKLAAASWLKIAQSQRR